MSIFGIDRIPRDGSGGVGAKGYTITDLGALPGGQISAALGIEPAGRAVGNAETGALAMHAVLFQQGQLYDLGTLGGRTSMATGVTNLGADVLVVGNSQTANGAIRAFFWYPYRGRVSGMQDLGALAGRNSYANAVNGQRIVGGAETAQGTTRATLFVPGYLPQDLGTLGGANSIAQGVNALGQIVGGAQTPDGASHAFLFTGEALQDLGTLGGRSSLAIALNASGQIAGVSKMASGSVHAFLYSGGLLKDLGTLGGNGSMALAMNAAGEVVGFSQTAGGGTHAFLYSGGMINLNSLLPPDSGWVLLKATGINDAGQIVGLGVHDSLLRGFLLSPAQSRA